MRTRTLGLFLPLLLLAPPVQAASPVAVNLTLSGTGVMHISGYTADGEFTSISTDVAGTATAPPFGSGALAGTGTVTQTDVSLDTAGQFTITFSPGNTISGTFDVPDSVILTSSSDTQASFTGTVATITGGTGIFAGASGSFPNLSGSIAAVSTPTVQNPVFNYTYTLSGPGTITAPNYNGSSTGALRFVPITPCRVADTRNDIGPFGAPPIAAQGSRDFNPQLSVCRIPQSAAAYAMNVTVIPHGPLSYLTLWPKGQTQPFVSTLNSFDGRIKANAAIVPAGLNGAVSVFVTDVSDVVLDINGYFESSLSLSDLVYYPVTPCRLVDTRLGTGPLAGPELGAGQSRVFNIQNTGCGNLSAARAYSLNVTVVPDGPLSFLTMWPSGTAMPLVSTLNAPTGTVVANAAIVPAGSDGGVAVYVTGNSHVLIDINGYFGTQTGLGLQFYPVNPCRLVDTRNAAGPLGGPALQPASQRTLPLLASACGAPATVQAYSLNATVVPAGPLGYLALWPAGLAQPVVSTLNAFDGSITSNAAIVPAGSGAAINAFATDLTNLILDLNGYFAP